MKIDLIRRMGFPVRLCMLLIGVGLLPGIAVMAQAGPTADLSVITPHNVTDLQVIDIPAQGRVSDLTWTPDGTRLIVRSGLGTWIYTPVSNDAPQFLREHFVQAISPDSRLLVTSQIDSQALFVWDIDSPTQPAMTLEGAGFPVLFHPDGEIMLTGRRSGVFAGSAVVWDVATGEALSAFGEAELTIDFFYLPVLDVFVLADFHSTEFWSLNDVTQPEKLDAFDFEALTVTQIGDGSLLMSVGVEQGETRSIEVLHYEIQPPFAVEILTTIDVDSYIATYPAPTMDGTTLAVRGGSITLWDLMTGAQLAELPFLDSGMMTTPDGILVAAYANDEEGDTTTLLDARGNALAVYGNTGRIRRGVAHPDGNTIAVASADDIWLWEMDDPTAVTRLDYTAAAGQGRGSDATHIVSPSGRWQAMSDGTTVVLQDAASGETVNTLTIPVGEISDEFREVVDGDDNLMPKDSVVTAIVMDETDRWLLVGGYRWVDPAQHGFTQVWRLHSDGKADLMAEHDHGRFTNRVNGYVFNGQQETVGLNVFWVDSCLRSNSGSVVLNLTTQTMTPVIVDHHVRDITYSPDGSLLVIGGMNDICTSSRGVVSLFDSDTLELLHQLSFDTMGVVGVDFSEDGTMLTVVMSNGASVVLAAVNPR